MDPDLAATVAQYRAELSESLLSPVVESRRLLGAIRHHDERWDGTGIPDQLPGLAIPRLARILRLLVQFDRLIRDGHTIAEALEGVRRDVVGGGSDPELHRAFERWLLAKDAHQVQP
jgi:response regulator RpfG family c-di-GMP phosphodiesterase